MTRPSEWADFRKRAVSRGPRFTNSAERHWHALGSEFGRIVGRTPLLCFSAASLAGGTQAAGVERYRAGRRGVTGAGAGALVGSGRVPGTAGRCRW